MKIVLDRFTDTDIVLKTNASQHTVKKEIVKDARLFVDVLERLTGCEEPLVKYLQRLQRETDCNENCDYIQEVYRTVVLKLLAANECVKTAVAIMLGSFAEIEDHLEDHQMVYDDHTKDEIEVLAGIFVDMGAAKPTKGLN
jgi:hypothetical protein